MSVKMVRSEVPESRVNWLINQRYKAFADLRKRNPTSEEKKQMSDQVIKLAKKANQDGQLI